MAWFECFRGRLPERERHQWPFLPPSSGGACSIRQPPALHSMPHFLRFPPFAKTAIDSPSLQKADSVLARLSRGLLVKRGVGGMAAVRSMAAASRGNAGSSIVSSGIQDSKKKRSKVVGRQAQHPALRGRGRRGLSGGVRWGRRAGSSTLREGMLTSSKGGEKYGSIMALFRLPSGHQQAPTGGRRFRAGSGDDVWRHQGRMESR